MPLLPQVFLCGIRADVQGRPSVCFQNWKVHSMKREDYKIYYIWLADAIGRSYPVFRELLDPFGSVYEIYRADIEAYSYLSARVKRHIEKLCDKNIGESVRIADYCASHGISIVTYEDEAYPSLLKEIEKPPLLLYIRGIMPDFEGKLHIAAVGTRSMTEYGKCVAYNFGYSLAKNGAVVVSGMALGCDSVAMCASLDAGGYCIGVLGCGVDIAYPPEHARFMRQIMKHGALISEYPPGTKAEPKHFPERNRIISGLSRATLMIEGDMKSGAMISARCAEAQGRVIYAVPGKLGEKSSEGTVALISGGARVATSANDILKEYTFLYRGKIDLKSYEEIPSDKIDGCLSSRDIKSGRAKFDKHRERKSSEAKNGISAEPQNNESVFASIKLKEDKYAENVGSKTAERDTSMLSGEIAAVYAKLPKGEMFCADDVAKYGISARDFMSSVTMLEIYGLARSYPGGRYTVQ